MLLLDKALTTTQQARAFVTACALRDPRCSLPWARETRVAVCVSLLHSRSTPGLLFSQRLARTLLALLTFAPTRSFCHARQHHAHPNEAGCARNAEEQGAACA